MNLKREKDGKVILVDTAEGSYGKQLRVTAPTAREILQNKNSNRYVALAAFAKVQEDKRIQDEVDRRMAAAAGGGSKKDEGSGDDTPVEIAPDILDAHQLITSENVEDDERLTKTGLVKKAALAEYLGRELQGSEHLAYIRHMTAVKKAAEAE